MNAFKAFINPSEAPQKKCENKNFTSLFLFVQYWDGRVKEKIVKLWNKLRAVPRNISAGKQ